MSMPRAFKFCSEKTVEYFVPVPRLASVSGSDKMGQILMAVNFLAVYLVYLDLIFEVFPLPPSYNLEYVFTKVNTARGKLCDRDAMNG